MKIVVGWAIAATVGLVLLSACGGGGEDEPTPQPRTATPEAVTPTPALERPDVPAVDCEPLFTVEEVDEALGWSIGDDRPGPILTARGEVCLHRLLNDSDVFVQIQPGTPADFEPGASVIGVFGEAVPAVGDEARWFGGEDSEAGGDVGALSVRQNTSLGAIHYRIFLGRPDLDSAAQREIAKTLALNALPRFPGVEVGYVNNLLVKEEAGEWTRGEGLVATLSLFAGEAEATQILRNPELVDVSGTDVILMAREYLEDGADAEAKTEITRLLEHLFPSRERLEAMAGIGLPTAARGLLAMSFGTARGADDCGTYLGEAIPCIDKVSDPTLDEMFDKEKYLIYIPKETPHTTHGWTDQHLIWAQEAMRESAIAYEALGEMLNVVIWFTEFDGPSTSGNPDFAGGDCFVNINLPMQGEKDKSVFQQNIAAAMAHCANPVLPPPEEEGEGEDCEIDICLPSDFYWPILF